MKDMGMHNTLNFDQILAEPSFLHSYPSKETVSAFVMPAVTSPTPPILSSLSHCYKVGSVDCILPNSHLDSS
jgi:hypothetical protein